MMVGAGYVVGVAGTVDIVDELCFLVQFAIFARTGS